VKKGARPRALKMQNEAKLKTAKIPVIPCVLSTNKTTLRPPQPKNEPKRTQIDTKCHPERPVPPKPLGVGGSEVLRAERSRRIYLNSHPDSSGFRILERSEILRMPIASCLLPDIKKMTSKPNFSSSQIFHKLPYIKKLECSRTLNKQKKANPIKPNVLDFRPKIRFIDIYPVLRPASPQFPVSSRYMSDISAPSNKFTPLRPRLFIIFYMYL
jgi:hypothetical protein